MRGLLGRLRRRPGSRAAIEREIREEMRQHIEMRIEDNLAAGMSPQDARADAERRFGDVDSLLAEGRRVRLSDSRRDPLRLSHRPGGGALPGEQPMKDLWQDLRFAVRTLLKTPAFTAVAVASLALGIGFNTAMFTLVDAALFKPRVAAEPDRMVRIYRVEPEGPDVMMSYPDMVDLRERVATLEGVVAGRNEFVTINLGGSAEFAFGEAVTHDYFDLLGIEPLRGREFAPDEDVTPGAHFVTVLSESFWRDRFGADPRVIGSEIVIAGTPFTVIGIMPRRFAGSTPPLKSQFWVPLTMTGTLTPGLGSVLERRGSHSLHVFGRLAAGATIPQARDEVAAIGTALAARYGDTNEDKEFVAAGFDAIRLHPDADRAMLPAAGILMAMVGMVLLIACANVANMMLARASARRPEIAVRLALGAGRGRVLRQLLTESVVLSAIGGVVAVLVARLALTLVLNAQTPFGIPISLDIELSGRVLLFAGLLSLLTGLLFGVAPALHSLRGDLSTSVRGDEALSSGRLRGSRTRNLLVVVQVAVSLVLLISASLMLRSLIGARAIDPGVETGSVLAVNTGLPFQGYAAEEAHEFHRVALERIAGLPGVERVAFTERLPLDTMTMLDGAMWIEGQGIEPGASPPDVARTTVSHDYFEMLGIAIRAGRAFGPEDSEGAPPVAIVNPAFADRFWPGESPLGRRFSTQGPEGPWVTIVGVHEPHKIRTLGEEPTPHVYLSFRQQPGLGFGALLARASGDPGEVLEAMRREITALDGNLAIFDTRTVSDHIDLGLLPVRLAALALTALGAVGALLAAIGVYGVVAFAVARRTHEIGIRMAIGADRSRVVRLVVRQGMRMVAVGIGVGVAASMLVTQALAAVLYGTSPVDPLSISLAAAGMLLVAGLANLLPARRAAGVDPVRALRSE